MEFVKYVINCFKVYYPKFLCKSKQPFQNVKPHPLTRRDGTFAFFCVVSAKMIIVDMPWMMTGENETVFTLRFAL